MRHYVLNIESNIEFHKYSVNPKCHYISIWKSFQYSNMI